MKGLAKKSFWPLNLLLLGLAAYLITLAINALIAHELRTEAMGDLRLGPPPRPTSPRTAHRDYRIIAERNLFDSALATPVEVPMSPEAKAYLRQIESHLSRKTVNWLFSAGKAFTKSQAGQEQLYAHCNIVEGLWCYFVKHEFSSEFDGRVQPEFENGIQRMPADLAREITKEIGTKHIEHARNNGVKIRCSKPKIGPHPPSCEIDWGWGKGWEKSLVR